MTVNEKRISDYIANNDELIFSDIITMMATDFRDDINNIRQFICIPDDEYVTMLDSMSALTHNDDIPSTLRNRIKNILEYHIDILQNALNSISSLLKKKTIIIDKGGIIAEIFLNYLYQQ